MDRRVPHNPVDMTERRKNPCSCWCEYVDTGKPVGSAHACGAVWHADLQCATIRNEMVALEQMGYVLQPHTSGGRVPDRSRLPLLRAQPHAERESRPKRAGDDPSPSFGRWKRNWIACTSSRPVYSAGTSGMASIVTAPRTRATPPPFRAHLVAVSAGFDDSRDPGERGTRQMMLHLPGRGGAADPQFDCGISKSVSCVVSTAPEIAPYAATAEGLTRFVRWSISRVDCGSS